MKDDNPEHFGPITDFDKKVIKEAFRRSAALSWLAAHFKTTEDEIAEILGLPKNKMARDKIHRDHNFYDHGFGQSRAFERRLEIYSEFLECDLENDGDFEKYQPCCYMKRDDPEFLRLKKEAEAIPESCDPRKEIRRLWILNRFTEYQGEEWTRLAEKMAELVAQIKWNVSDHLLAYEGEEFKI